jgi:hypothetical protein
MARVATGPAFEGWLNAEIGVILNERQCVDDRKGEYLWAEKTKRDLVICKPAEDLVKADVAGWVIEVKLVYPWPPSKMLSTLRRLREQVSPPAGKTYADEDKKTRRAGIIFGVWFQPRPEKSAWAASTTRKAFFSILKAGIVDVFPHGPRDPFAIQHLNFYYPINQLQQAGWETVSVGMMYVTQRPRASVS